ncbi:ubiquitin carboxyl-terminal hydrolase 19-like isoform X1 [Musa acuminata AAA Group]|uniref:ubiquitin carboxyl-terminal hydrolase 19-like isoform X1 n=1 Tax=Musa acuminata AAA Group TaxID=214697 RepID=UPI0031DFD370
MLPAVDPSALLRFVLSAILIFSGALLLVKRAASRYFVVDAGFEAGSGFEGPRRAMCVGEEDGCAACGRPATKKCSRCMAVRYCSQACQSKHWKSDRRFCCEQSKSTVEVTLSESQQFSSISLMPACGTRNILQKSTKILFPYEEFVKLFNWDNPGFTPCGLVNCGNSCFANVVLQCLTSTRPLMAYLLKRTHSRECNVSKRDGWCFLCELQFHVQRARESMHPFSPINILSGLHNIGGNLDYGRQEDAHEFMRFAIDRMQSVCLDEFGGEKTVDTRTQETTLIQYIFGGRLQSQVTCTKCNMVSNRFENMMDLTVEIQGDVESLEECLDQFTVKEWLDGENKYKCDGCNDYVKAWKRLTVNQAPNILTITLKRFQSGRFGKLNKRVTFPQNLDLTPYMSEDGDGTDIYTLYAVVVHLDMLNASFFGHYICYTKDYHGRWYRIDDCEVINVEVEDVLSERAYMLLYSRKTARGEPYLCPPGNTLLPETDQKASITSEVAKFISASCHSPKLISLPNPGEVPELHDSGHDRGFSAHVDSSRVKKLDNVVMVDTPVDNVVAGASSDVKPMLLHRGDIDDPSSSSSSIEDLEEGNDSLFSFVTKDHMSVGYRQLDSPDISCIEVHLEKCQEPFSSDAGNGMGKSGASGIGERPVEFMCALDKSINFLDIAAATEKAFASTTAASMELDNSDDSITGSEEAGGTCRASDPADTVNSLDGNKASSYQEKHFNGKPKPLFPPGFLDKSGRKMSQVSAKKTQVESCSDGLVPKSIREKPTEPMYALDESLNLVDTVVAITKQAPIASLPTLSIGPEASVPRSEDAVETVKALDPTSKVRSMEDTSYGHKGNKASSLLENDSNGKPKPLFPRGFLHESGRKMTQGATEKARVQSHPHAPKNIRERPKEPMCALDESLNLKDVAVAITAEAPIASVTCLSMGLQPSDDSVPGLEDVVESGSSSSPTNLEDMIMIYRNEGKKASFCQESGSIGKPKPLFPRGFLDKPVRKMSQDTAEGLTQAGSHSDALVPKENSFCNEHSDLRSSCACNKVVIPSEASLVADGLLKRSLLKSSDKKKYMRKRPCKLEQSCKADHYGSAEHSSDCRLESACPTSCQLSQ